MTELLVAKMFRCWIVDEKFQVLGTLAAEAYIAKFLSATFEKH